MKRTGLVLLFLALIGCDNKTPGTVIIQADGMPSNKISAVKLQALATGQWPYTREGVSEHRSIALLPEGYVMVHSHINGDQWRTPLRVETHQRRRFIPAPYNRNQYYIINLKGELEFWGYGKLIYTAVPGPQP